MDGLGTLKAVLFDFDGTLADSYPAITASVNHVRGLHRLPPLAEAEVRRHVGRGPEYLIARTVPGSDGRDVGHYREHHPSVMRDGTRLMPGAAEALAALHRAGLRLAVCSNKPLAFTRELLQFLGLGPLIELALGPEDVPRPKPAPDMLTTALERLGLAPAQALYVGDMVVDIETARAAGVRVWVLPTGSNDRATLLAGKPDRVVKDLFELRDLLSAGRRG